MRKKNEKICDVTYLEKQNKTKQTIVFSNSTMTRSASHPRSTRDKSKNLQKL